MNTFPSHRRWAAWLLIAALVPGLAPLARADAPRMALAPGDPAPRLRGQTYPAGDNWTLDYSSYRFVVVNFWATWCPPCFLEMPALQRLYARYREQGLLVVGVYAERKPANEIFEVIEPLGIGYPLMLSHKDTDAEWGGIHSLPTTFLIDAQGRILRRYVGATEAGIAGMEADLAALTDGLPLPTMALGERGIIAAPPGTVNWKPPEEFEVPAVPDPTRDDD